jgi:parallel beta-helix repeat protein
LRRVASSLVVMLLFLGLFAFIFIVQPVRAPPAYIIINPDGSISSPVPANITTSDNVTYTFTGNNYLTIVVNRSSIIINGMGYTLQVSGGIGFYLEYPVHNVTIENTTITNSGWGIDLNGSYNDTVSDNNITANSDYGIGVHYSSNNNTLSGNNITANYHGIYVEWSVNNTLSDNNITADYDGIYIESSSNNNTLSGNNVIANSNCGICLYSSSSNILSDNNITNNSFSGVYLRTSSSCSVSGNNITNNDYGVLFQSSSGNTFYHNNFVENAYKVYSDGSPNTWDNGYPSGGNYWSDYTGADYNQSSGQNISGSDGIGDTEYAIDVNNTDNYPLMGMFSEFKATSEYHVQTICNSTISDFQFNGTAISFNVTGEDGTSGFCRICIPTALMSSPFKVYVNGTEISYNLLLCSNETYSYLYFNYTHSTEEVIIISEFPSFLTLPIFMIATLIAVVIYKKRTVKMERLVQIRKTG